MILVSTPVTSPRTWARCARYTSRGLLSGLQLGYCSVASLTLKPPSSFVRVSTPDIVLEEGRRGQWDAGWSARLEAGFHWMRVEAGHRGGGGARGGAAGGPRGRGGGGGQGGE